MSERAEALAGVIRDRRVTRSYGPGAIAREELEALLEAAYRAPHGGGRRPVKFVVLAGGPQLRRVIDASPGILGRPAALIVLCLDWSRAPHLEVDDPRTTHSLQIDAGAAMENILLTAEALGIGAGPVTSFNRPTVARLLELPHDWTPLIIVTLGRLKVPRAARPQDDDIGARIGAVTTWHEGEPMTEKAPVDPEHVRDAFLELMLYLAAAARGNVDEQVGYGPLRLLEGAQRAVRSLERFGLADADLQAFQERVTAEGMKVTKDPDHARVVADDLLALLSRRLGVGG
jgi:nitroreductase